MRAFILVRTKKIKTIRQYLNAIYFFKFQFPIGKATNSLGSESVSATLKVISRGDAELEGGYSAQGLEHLQYLEDSALRHHKRSELVIEELIKPRFLTKPKDLNLKEQMRAHFECKLEPINDANLTVEWFKDGQPLQCGSRFKPIFDFGYVALDILQVGIIF